MREAYKAQLDDTSYELQEIRKWINADKNKFDSKTRYLVSYSVVKASGTLEVVFKRIIYDYLTFGVGDKTATYIEKMILDSSYNPSTGKISQLLQNISSEWKIQFDTEVKSSGQKDKNNSLVQLRNDFAHGEAINVSIDTVITYYDASIEILEILSRVVTE